MIRGQIAFFDVHNLDQEVYRRHLGSDYDLIMSEEPLTEANAGTAKNAGVLSVHITSHVTAEAMAKMPGLKHIACRTTGYDNVDLDYARSRALLSPTFPAMARRRWRNTPS